MSVNMFDTDGNGVLDGNDPQSAEALTWFDPNAGPHGATVLYHGGDLVAVWNDTAQAHLTALDFA